MNLSSPPFSRLLQSCKGQCDILQQDSEQPPMAHKREQLEVPLHGPKSCEGIPGEEREGRW